MTSQFAPIEWCKSIPDAVIAESILNRLAVGAEIITLEGDNLSLIHISEPTRRLSRSRMPSSA